MPAPITDSPLFTAEDLVGLVDEEISEEKAALVESVVWGWLKPVLGLEQRPDLSLPENEQVFSWALELGVIFCENPKGLAAYQLGEERSQYSAERRGQILDAAGSGGAGTASGSEPRGTFPPPLTWPTNFWGA